MNTTCTILFLVRKYITCTILLYNVYYPLLLLVVIFTPDFTYKRKLFSGIMTSVTYICQQEFLFLFF
jgi:hypothetical protein